jgi:hypothetical protein
MSLSLVAASCGDRSELGSPDGGSTGSAGMVGTGSAGTGTTGKAGTTGTTGGAGMVGTGSAGTGTTGKAGTTGTTGGAGMVGTGSGGSTGAAGTGGKAGTGGTMCGPVCAIFCPYGNVVDASGCPTCKCNPAPACKPEECQQAAGAALPAPTCGGKVIPPVCTRDPMTGKCYQATPRCACDAIACPAIACAYGNKIDPMTGCATCECNPAPATCTLDQCPALPPIDYTMVCADGSVMKPTCGRSTPGGMCIWTFPKCPPPKCPGAIPACAACPNGGTLYPDANGCPTCNCAPPKACAALTDWKSCTADMRCQWLQPGCGTPSLATPGCFAREEVGCQTDGDCPAGRTCLKRIVDPCFSPGGGVSCDACGASQTICL